MAIQLAADRAPNGARHCWAPDARPPPAPPEAEGGERRLPHGAEAQDVAAQPAGHGQHGGDERPARTRDVPPAVDPGRMEAERLLDRGHPSLAHSHPHSAGVGGQPVDVRRCSRPASATAARQASTVSERGSTMSRRPRADRPTPESTARCSNRSSPSRWPGRREFGRDVGLERWWDRPVGSNMGSHTRPRGARIGPATSRPMWTSPHVAPDDVGGQPHARVLGQGHHGDRVGRGQVGVPLVLVDGVPDHRGPTGDRGRRPRTGSGTPGRWAPVGAPNVPQSAQPWMRRAPSAPDVQNHSFHGVSSGSGLIGDHGRLQCISGRIPGGAGRAGELHARPKRMGCAVDQDVTDAGGLLGGQSLPVRRGSPGAASSGPGPPWPGRRRRRRPSCPRGGNPDGRIRRCRPAHRSASGPPARPA